MLKIHEIREMIRLIDQSSISEIEVEENGAAFQSTRMLP